MEKHLPDTGYLNALRKYVLTKAGVQSLSPGDCRNISLKIKEITGKVVSETTLKRFLGFAKKNYNFSAYTLNALCDYIGFSGWESFRNSIEPGLTETHSSKNIWSDYYRKSREVSSISLQSLKDHSGIPFQYTISRSAIETDFEIFMEEDYTCFGLIGASGMGKSIQVAHLAERFFLNEKAPYKDSILWLFKKGALFDFIPHDIYLEETLYEQFGLRSEFNFIDYFRKKPEDVSGHLVLMMDGFDDYLDDIERRDKVFQQFFDLMSYLRDIKWVKLVFSMRPATWDILNTKINSSSFLKTKWFPGVTYQNNTKSNVVTFLPAEIKKIFEQTPFYRYGVKKKLVDLLRYPTFLTTYIQQMERNEEVSHIGEVHFFKLISSYLGNRVHRSNLDIEKWALIKKMLCLSLTDEGCANRVDEAVLLDGFIENADYICAYRELLRTGLLQREHGKAKESSGVHHVSFVDESVYVYLLFYAVVEKEKEVSVEKLFQKIKNKFQHFPKQTLLLKCIFWHLLEKRTKDVLKPLFSNAFSMQKRAELFLFITDYIHSFPQALSEEEKIIFCKEAISFFTNHLFYIGGLNRDYDVAMSYLARINGSKTDKINLQIIRSILAVLRLDDDALADVMKQIEQLSEAKALSKYPILPLTMLRHLFDLQISVMSHSDAVPAPVASFLSDGEAFYNKKLSNEILLSYQLSGLILQAGLSSGGFLTLTEKIRATHPEAMTDDNYRALQILLDVQEMVSIDESSPACMAKMKKRFEKLTSLVKTDGASYFDIFKLLIEGNIFLLENQEKAAVCIKKAYLLSESNGYTLLQVITALRLIKLYKKGILPENPVEIIKNIRHITKDTRLPIKELFLQKMMMETS